MVQHRRFWVVGGDRRQRALGQLLRREGHSVECRGLEEGPFSLAGLEGTDCVLLPLPVAGGPGLLNAPLISQKIPLEAVFQALSPGQLLFGGRADGDCQRLAAERGTSILDYTRREEFAVANAVPTAEGAVQLALEELDCTIQGARVLVLGFGRVGTVTAQRFRALGAEVTVAARRQEALAWARVLGFAPAALGTEPLEAFRLVVNTIPAPVLDAARLRRLAPDCVVLDLASSPGGVDWGAAEALGLRAIHALSLPGKTAPETAAAIIRDSIFHMLEERA